MSFTEIREEIHRLTPEERAELEKLLRILRVTSAPGYRERVAHADAELRAGRGVKRDELQSVLAQDSADQV